MTEFLVPLVHSVDAAVGAPSWLDALEAELEADHRAMPCRTPFLVKLGMRPAVEGDREWLYELHREAMREYVDATWGWDEAWQRDFFDRNFRVERMAIVRRSQRNSGYRDVGYLSLTAHWRHWFLRDIELLARERGRGIGSVLIGATLSLARRTDRYVMLHVLRVNPARKLYGRLGFRVVEENADRLSMRAP